MECDAHPIPLLSTLQEWLRRWLRRAWTLSIEDQDDVAQEAVQRFLERFQREPASDRPYLVLRECARDAIRKRQRAATRVVLQSYDVAPEAESAAPDAETIAWQAEIAAVVRHCIEAAIASEDRDLLQLLLQGYSLEEVGKMLHEAGSMRSGTKGAAWARARRARAALLQCIEKDLQYEEDVR